MARALTRVLSVAVLGIAFRALAFEAQTGGTVLGKITTKEPALKAIAATIDSTVCGRTLPDESIAVDAAGRLANVVVTAVGVKSRGPADVTLSNEKCAFAPRVAALPVGSVVKMVSKDPVLHTMRATAADGTALFNISLPVPNLAMSRPVNASGLVTLSCSTHTWMRGYLVMTDDLSAVSDADGHFRLENVPAGLVELRFWHEKLKAAPVKVTVREGQSVSVDVVLTKS